MRRTLVYSVLILAGLLIAWQVWQLAQSPALAHCAVDDFIEYWTAARLNLAGRDPYDPYALMDAQRALRPTIEFPVMMWNPPWTLSLVGPVALMPYPLGRIVWCLASIAAVVASAGWLWSVYAGPPRRWWLAILVTFAFAPTLFAIGMGQISPLVLLGVAGFAWAAARQRWALAGGLLALTLVKPHLVYLVWAALALWSWDRRQGRAVLAAAVVLGAMLAWPLAANPHVLADYRQALSDRPPQYWIAPTLGVLLRLLIDWRATWLQMLPSLAGLAWLAWHWRRHRTTWIWSEQLPWLLLVSVATSAYGWMFDQVVLLVPLTEMLARWLRRPQRHLAWCLAAWLAVTVTAYVLWPLALLSGPQGDEPVAGLLARVLGEPNMFWNIVLAPLYGAAYMGSRRLVRSAGEGEPLRAPPSRPLA